MPEQEPQTPPAPPTGEPNPQTPQSGPPAGGSPEDELPEWARKELSKVRGEAAGYRTRLRDAETKLSTAKTAEEFEAALGEVKAENARLERAVLIADTARKFDLPAELASRLAGATAEELEVDAKKLQALLAPPAPQTLTGGLDPTDGDDGEMDPRKLARSVRRR